MHPLTLLFLIFGIPALMMLGYAYVRGSTPLRSYIVTRILLTIPMVLILVSVVFFVLRVMPGSVAPCSGPTTCTMPWRRSPILNSVMPNSEQLLEPEPLSRAPPGEGELVYEAVEG